MVQIVPRAGPPPYKPTGRVKIRTRGSLKANSGSRQGFFDPETGTHQADVPDEKQLRLSSGVMQVLDDARNMLQQAAGLATRSRKRQRIGVAQCFAAARVLIEDD